MKLVYSAKKARTISGGIRLKNGVSEPRQLSSARKEEGEGEERCIDKASLATCLPGFRMINPQNPSGRIWIIRQGKGHVV